jgi:hypothetical protein
MQPLFQPPVVAATAFITQLDEVGPQPETRWTPFTTLHVHETVSAGPPH